MGKKIKVTESQVEATEAQADNNGAREEESKAVEKMEVDEQAENVEDKNVGKSKNVEQSAFMIKERKARTVFVGNVPVPATAKQLQKVFRACGKIEKIWFRSICISDESKRPQRAKIIQKDFGNSKDSKNAYILFKDVTEA